MVKMVEIENIVIDLDVYPRVQTTWMKAYEYSLCMKAGNIFPAIKLGKYKGTCILIDGLHRLNAHKLLGISKIKATITPYTNKHVMFIDAIKANNTQGKPLTVMDKTLIFKKLRGFKVTDEQISSLLGTPKDQFSVYVNRLIGEEGLQRPVKEIVADALETGLITPEEAFNMSDLKTQNLLVSRNVEYALKQTVNLLENNLINLQNPKVKEYCEKIYQLLSGVLNR